MKKIIKLKKEFWKNYTKEYNKSPEAFELMRDIGFEQGKYSEKHSKTKREANK